MPEFRPDPSPDAEGPVRIWSLPDPQDRYVIGADVAEGLAHGDYSDASVLSVASGELVAKWHGHIPVDEFAVELARLGRFYNRALLGVESNNHGLTVIVGLRHMNYPNLYRSVDPNTRLRKVEWGWRTTSSSKPLMIDELARALRSRDIVVNDGPTLAELRTYRRDERGRMSGSPHDDRVMSLAIANQMRKLAFLPEYLNPIDDAYTLDWWARLGDEAAAPSRIGAHNVRTHHANG